jgi:hypothetical protein
VTPARQILYAPVDWRRPVRIPLVLGVLLLAAGCTSDEPPLDDEARPTADDWAERALASGPDHDHTDRTLHAHLTTPNFQILGYHPLTSDSLAATPGGHFCGDAQAGPDGRRIAVVEQRTIGGFLFVDVTDPAAPIRLGELVMPTTRVYDVAMASDGRHALLVTTDQTPLGSLPDLRGASDLRWKGACDDEWQPVRDETHTDPIPRPFSLLLVDLFDPDGPRIVDQRPIPAAGHSVYSTRIDGRDWILVAVAHSRTYYYQFYELVTTPFAALLNHLATHALRGTAGEPPQPTNGMVGSHDGWIAKHPGTGQTLAYLAGQDQFQILDLAEPLQPRLVGAWTDHVPGREGYSGSLHSVYPMSDLRDGRHYTLLGPEFANHPVDHPTGILWVLDTTDPAHVQEVAAWTLPFEVEWNGTYMFSNHYFVATPTTAFITMYHGGLWALDLSRVAPDTFTLLDSVGVFMPDRTPPHPPATQLRWNPTVQDISLFEDGSLVTYDGSGGLYTLRFDASNPMTAPTPWPVSPVTP